MIRSVLTRLPYYAIVALIGRLADFEAEVARQVSFRRLGFFRRLHLRLWGVRPPRDFWIGKGPSDYELAWSHHDRKSMPDMRECTLR